jgi:hypothetical protein
MAGAIWGLTTWMKWAPAITFIVLAPRARLWGLGWLAVSVLISLATLPLTIAQLEALFAYDRPLLRLDYLVLLWAFVPWLWRREEPFAWLRPTAWRGAGGAVASWLRAWGRRVRTDPAAGGAAARRGVVDWARALLGLEARA